MKKKTSPNTVHNYQRNDGEESNLSPISDKMQLEANKSSIGEENGLKELYKGRLSYVTDMGTFYVLGNLSSDLASLKATIAFETKHTYATYRSKIDLYERSHIINFVRTICEAEDIKNTDIERELLRLTNLVEQYREKNLGLHEPAQKKAVRLLPPEKEREAIAFLTEPNVINRIDNCIELCGVVGEESTRKMVFVIASTYKMFSPLHGLVQGTSGSGKTHLINVISELMPPEDVLHMTRVTSKSFYHYKDDDLVGKLLLIQDIDGLDDEAMYAFREMQSAGFVSSSTIRKDEGGNLKSVLQHVKASFASLVATTHADIYFDNLSRSIVLGVDESEAQTLRIIQAQNNNTAGLVDRSKALKAKELLQNCIRVLKPYEVVNPYANKITLPVKAKMQRRLNNHFQDVIKQVTLLHQFQRKKDEHGRLITTVEDISQATEIMFDAIMWKVDELDSSLRQFFEQVKRYITDGKRGKQSSFTTRELRQAFHLSRSQTDRYVQELKRLEYIQICEGSANRGYGYKVTYWDDIETIRQEVKEQLLQQIKALQ